MADFTDAQRVEIKETLEFWDDLATKKEIAAKNAGYIKKEEARAYRDTYYAILKLTQANDKDVRLFWGAAIKRWDIDFIKYIPVQLNRMYEQYYIVPPICMKKRNAYVAKIITALKKLESHIKEANSLGNALNDRFSIVVSDFYQPDDIGIRPDFDAISFYALIKALQNEVKALAVSSSYAGFDKKEAYTSAGEKEFIKESQSKITKYLACIAAYSRDDNLGSFLEQAFSSARKDRFFPKSSLIPKPDYQIIRVLPFSEEIRGEIIRLQDENIFYRHHMSRNESSRFKAFGLSVQAKRIEGNPTEGFLFYGVQKPGDIRAHKRSLETGGKPYISRSVSSKSDPTVGEVLNFWTLGLFTGQWLSEN